ncbi:hypothetical protein [Mycobacterium sp.]|jgi:hypothetical protein|uniref:hypothetical protein n=1 Tax=Mycobacterium sp. TaxID=1785 RepID=UPI002D59AD4E|nr:hypothetical protein [Mycobacterium sp.]HZA10780.1 hypothetical protein [Mycobacterium sp.]
MSLIPETSPAGLDDEKEPAVFDEPNAAVAPATPLTRGEVSPAGDVEASPAGDTEASPAPVLIPENVVVFSTAAAVPVPRIHWWMRVRAALAGVFAGSNENPKPRRPHYPKRSSYLEASCMSRAMDRL